MRNETKARGLCERLAALADPIRNDNEHERSAALAKLIALCDRYGFNLRDFGIEPVASPDSGEAETVQPKRAKRAKRAKASAKPEPSKADKRDSDRERAQANRAYVQPLYAGPSAASHASVPPALADAIARVAVPVQRAKSATTRDESGICLAAKHANGSFDFSPVAGTFDLGVLSRLSSLGLIAVSPVAGKIRITKRGRDLAAIVAKRAA